MKVLLVGESWHVHEAHIKGFDNFVTNAYATGERWLKQAMESAGIEFEHMPSHVAATDFPATLDELKQYSVILLSDIGSNTLLLHPDTFLRSIRTPNRIKLLKEYVAQGGGLCMIGGYMTFQGIDGRGRWRGTAVEEVLPVEIDSVDDRVETPEGIVPTVVQPSHPVLEGIGSDWPWFLGYNRVSLKPGAELLLSFDGDPLLALGQYEKGRTAAFTSDCAPHWGPPEFVEWEHYPRFWSQLVRWLAGQIG